METSKFYNWVKEYGWRHLIALMFVTFAVYPILFVATNSIADFANLTNSKLIPDGLTLKHYKLLSSDPLVPYFKWLYNTYKVALIAAFLILSGVSKSGSPAPSPITSFPAALSSLAF